MKAEGLLIVGLAALVAAPAATPQSPAPSDTPALTGHWRFDADKSEDARQKMHDAMASRYQGGGSGGGMGGHRGGGMGGHHGGGYQSQGGSGGGSDPRAALRPFFEPPAELTITPGGSASEVAVVDNDGRVRQLHADGKKYKATDGESETTTHWEASQLIVETKASNGSKLTEAFSAQPEQRQLLVVVTAESSRIPSVSVRRVYDAVDAAK